MGYINTVNTITVMVCLESMRLHIGRRDKVLVDNKLWRHWFAWYPVLINEELVLFETVFRRARIEPTGEHYSSELAWEYRNVRNR